MSEPLLPPATIGIIGGGQLGMMLAREAGRMGYRTAVWDPDPACPASHLAGRVITAPFTDAGAAEHLASCSDVITYEFENVDAGLVRRLESLRPTRPGSAILAVSQNRRREKHELRARGFPVVQYDEASGAEDTRRAIEKLGLPVVVKTATSGYDGKGQAVLRTAAECSAYLAGEPVGDVVIERLVPLACELSVIAVRNAAGATVTFPLAENVHRENILFTTSLPARVHETVRRRAEELGRKVIESFGLAGILCVEMFLTHDDELLINELAPRPHNSGHYSLDACDLSQFEALIRAICGLPVPSPRLLTPCVMVNLLGKHLSRVDLPALLARPGVKIHLYGKTRVEPRRKMGHVTLLGRSEADLLHALGEITNLIGEHSTTSRELSRQ